MTLLLFIAAVWASPGELARQIRDTWSGLRANGAWVTPTLDEREALVQAVEALTRQADTCPAAVIAEQARGLAAVGLELDEVRTQDAHVLLIHDGPHPHGAGLYAIRCGPARPRVLQAPHSMFDRRTGAIVRAMFAEGDARAAAWNTVQRYRATSGEQQDAPIHPADVTREYGSLFHAATVAMATADADLRFVQLHGFTGRDWDAVLSTGDAEEPPTAEAARLSEALGRVAVFGRDVEFLGGTHNVQGQALSRFQGRRFLHIELSPEVRERLAKDAQARARFEAGLRGAGW